MKTKRIKAIEGRWTLGGAMHAANDEARCWSKVLLLPADAESFCKIVEQVAEALAGDNWLWSIQFPNKEDIRGGYRDDARAALKSIGITAPKGGKK